MYRIENSSNKGLGLTGYSVESIDSQISKIIVLFAIWNMPHTKEFTQRGCVILIITKNIVKFNFESSQFHIYKKTEYI